MTVVDTVLDRLIAPGNSPAGAHQGDGGAPGAAVADVPAADFPWLSGV